MAIFIELSNPIHGGQGWELGKVLWSPVAPPWNNIMKQPQKGDIIIHSIKDKKRNINHKLWGISTVYSPYRIPSIAPPIPDKWGNYDSYYQIPLIGYKELKEKTFLQDFIDDNEKELKEMIPQKSFYTETGAKMQPAQKYLASVSEELYQLLIPYIESNCIYESSNPTQENIILEGDTDEYTYPDKNGTTQRVTRVINRIIRDTTLIKQIKQKYDNQCQICGKRIKLPSGKFYSEGHHLKKLGGFHQGPDIEENIILLCPSHHVEFDYGSIAINTATKKIIHIDKKNFFHNKDLAYERSNLDKEFLDYHLKVLFNN